MNVYHIEIESQDESVSHDLLARRKVEAVRGQVEAAGGQVNVSRGFGLVPAVIVLHLPTEQKPESFFPDDSAKLMGEKGE